MGSSRYFPLQAESDVLLQYGDRLGVVRTWPESGRQRVLAATGLSGVVTMYVSTGREVAGTYIVTGCTSSGQGGFLCNLVPVDTVEASTERNEAEAQRILNLLGHRS